MESIENYFRTKIYQAEKEIESMSDDFILKADTKKLVESYAENIVLPLIPRIPASRLSRTCHPGLLLGRLTKWDSKIAWQHKASYCTFLISYTESRIPFCILHSRLRGNNRMSMDSILPSSIPVLCCTIV